MKAPHTLRIVPLLFLALVPGLLLDICPASAQQQPPFVFALTGGLFFPARQEFSQIYHATSDHIWSVGFVLPGVEGFYFTGDYGKFTSTGFFDPATNSGAEYEEKIIHLGMLNKVPINRVTQFRLLGGVNRVNVRETSTKPGYPDISVETETLYGFYGGVGIEESFGDPHYSVFVDVQYDYSRSHDAIFFGDFGGTRAVFGVNLILF